MTLLLCFLGYGVMIAVVYAATQYIDARYDDAFQEPDLVGFLAGVLWPFGMWLLLGMWAGQALRAREVEQELRKLGIP